MTEKPTVSLVIPALNEENGILATIARAPAGLREIIVVDGGSKDRTVERAREAGAKVIVEPRRGYGLAYKVGFEAATSDLIATADADGTYPIEMLPHVIELLQRKDLTFVSCSRFPLVDPHAMPGRNRMGNFGLTLVASLLYQHAFRDICSGMWLFRRAILPELDLRADGWTFSNEIKFEALVTQRERFVEFVVPYEERVGATHNTTVWRTGFAVLGHMARERARHFLRARGLVPGPTAKAAPHG
jgi:glycosyltransferase involved in cell wall biosynthesis